jgi:hypothetical protein
MTNLRNVMLASFAACLASSGPASAQKFTQAAPRAEDWAAIAKLPDFTGIWETPLGGGGGRGAASPNPNAGGRAGAPPAGRGSAAGAGRGRGADRGPGPSLTPEYAAKAKAQPGAPPDESAANCLPPGLPGIMTQPYPYEILMTPGQVTIISEAYTQVRHIYTDGRPLPEEPDPTFYGTSVGHWENNTLVVETVGFEQVPRGLSFPYSDKMKIVERFRMADIDTVMIETTITDPEALTMPYSMPTRTLKRHRNWTLAEYVCEENNRNFVDANGNAGVKLANPLSAPR